MRNRVTELPNPNPTNKIVRTLKWVTAKVKSWFEPEEVVVTFDDDGIDMSYTYKKVEHKQVA